MKKYNKRKVIILSFLVILVLVFTQLAFSRAGGGGSSSMGSGGGSSYGGSSSYGSSSDGDGALGILGLILLPFSLIYSAFSTVKYKKKNQEARELLARLSEKDSSWDLSRIKGDIEMAYFKVQEAWMERDQTIARDYMSERLFNKHKTQTDLMIKQHRKNILLNINLIESTIVQVVDYKNDSRDMMWVYINGSMIDYIINDQTKEILSGDPNAAEVFTELWRFVRGPKGWVLDEIDQTVTQEDFQRMSSFSEEIRG